MTSMATSRLIRTRAVIAAGGCHDGHDVLTNKSKLFLSLRQFARSSNLTHSYFPQILQFKRKNEMPSHLDTRYTSTFEVLHEFLSEYCHPLHSLHHFQIIFMRKFFEEKKYKNEHFLPLCRFKEHNYWNLDIVRYFDWWKDLGQKGLQNTKCNVSIGS